MILVFSDSHGKGARINDVLSRYEKLNVRPEAILFLGDGLRELENMEFGGIPFYAVRGNCDFFSIIDGLEVPDERILRFSEYTVIMMHGHRYGVKSGYGAAISRAREVGADILCFGHTHVALEKYMPADAEGGKPLYIMNPGSIGEYHSSASFGVIDFSPSGISLSHGLYYPEK